MLAFIFLQQKKTPFKRLVFFNLAPLPVGITAQFALVPVEMTALILKFYVEIRVPVISS